MKPLLTVTAIIELGAGVALLAVPSLTASLLLGVPLEVSAGVSLARVGGCAIVTLAIVCWLMRDAPGLVARGLVAAMTFYNIAVAAVLVIADFGQGLHGMLLWPAIVFHAAMGLWCIATSFRNDNGVFFVRK